MGIIISMGEKSSTGYSIKAEKVDISENNINIYVKETSPGVGIVVENQESGYKFKKI